MLEQYFGSRLHVYVSDILESNPAVQTGPTELRQARAKCREQNCRVRDAKAIALMFRFIIADAVLQRCYNKR